MRIIQTRSNAFELEYDNGQLVSPGDVVTDNNGITLRFGGIGDGYVHLHELSDPHTAEPTGHVAVGEFLDKFTAGHERLGQAGTIGIVRDHPSHGEDSRGPSVVDRGSREIAYRWAKETIGLAATELNEAYAEFEISRDGYTIPNGSLRRAAERLREAMQKLEIGDPDSEIPF